MLPSWPSLKQKIPIYRAYVTTVLVGTLVLVYLKCPKHPLCGPSISVPTRSCSPDCRIYDEAFCNLNPARVRSLERTWGITLPRRRFDHGQPFSVRGD